jgi:hypothetical protein
MVIVFRCSPEAKEALDQLKERGELGDYADVINAALVNYAALSAALDAKGAIVLPETTPPVAPVPSRRRAPAAALHAAESPVARPLPARVALPAVFTSGDLPTDPPCPLANLPSDVFFPGQPVPVDRWVFGQYSKLLPAKATVRAMANLLLQHPGGFPIEKIAPQVAQEAALLGQYLEAHDQHHGLTRDEALATGFPSTGENADKSRLRYANQFVASINKQGQLGGLLADLKLIGITSERTRRIQLTKPGWAFAILQNPILDGPASATSDRLSNDERMLLIEHIARFVPAEDYAFRTIMQFIKEGLTTPDQLDDSVKKLSASKKEGVTDAFITTQRSGLISRMADLGLISRLREGVRVSYLITDTGTTYANRSAAA